MNPDADRDATLERERRWMRPAGIASIAGVLLLAGGLAFRITALNADTASEALLELSADDLGPQLLVGSVLSGLAYLCFGVPLTHLFLAARDRAERMRGRFVGIAVVSVVLLAIGSVISAGALSSAADTFAEDEAERAAAPAADEQKGAKGEAAQGQAAQDGEDGASGGTGPAGAQADDEADTGDADGGASDAAGDAGDAETTVEATTATEGEGASEQEPESEQDAEEAADDRAEDAIRESPGYGIGGILGLTGTLGFAIAYFYTSLWSLRTGLLTRFWGSLGMAAAVVFVLLAQGAPEILVFQELWFLALGLMLLGFWPGDRPPAWESGEAMPWQKAGERPPDPGEGAPDVLDGEGREVGGPLVPGEDPPPPSGANGSGGPDSPPPRKRKRRRDE